MSDGLIARIKRDLEDTRLIVLDTVQRVLERGERLEQLNDRTQALLAQSERFEDSISDERRKRRNNTRIFATVASGIRWTVRQSIAATFLVLHYLGQLKSKGLWLLSVLFPTHEGLSVERYNEVDLYYDPDYVPLDDDDEAYWTMDGEHEESDFSSLPVKEKKK